MSRKTALWLTIIVLAVAVTACKRSNEPKAEAADLDVETARAPANPAAGPSPESWAHIAPPVTAAERQRYAHVPRLGLGRPATDDEIAAWDIDVMPDGTGLPVGSGSVAEGKALYEKQCTQCHGAKGEGADYDVIAGREPREGFPFGRDPKLRPTVGNYWPYATSLYDYVNRAMPQAVPGTLPPDDVYSIVAYVLYLNEVVPEDAVLDQSTLPRVVMPAHDRFVVDDRRGGADLR